MREPCRLELADPGDVPPDVGPARHLRGYILLAHRPGRRVERRRNRELRIDSPVAGEPAAVGWALSIALSIAPSTLYAPYGGLTARPGGLSGLSDQRLAAGMMLVPGSIAFAIVAAVALTRSLAEDGRRAAPGPRVEATLIPSHAEEEIAVWER